MGLNIDDTKERRKREQLKRREGEKSDGGMDPEQTHKKWEAAGAENTEKEKTVEKERGAENTVE